MIQKKYQIFVSSTFDDLRDERRAVSEQILNLGHLPVGMELFHASNEDQWSHIVRRIKQCDYYIVIIAERYGSTADDGVSYTEKEYRLAVNEGIPVAAFLLADEARKNRPNKLVEGRQRKKIDNFREHCKTRLIKYWSNPTELALAVTNSLSALFSDHPRPGLVPSTDVPSSKTLETISSLADKVAYLEVERENLKKRIAEIDGGQEFQNIRASLERVTLKHLSHVGGFEWFQLKRQGEALEGADSSPELIPADPKATLWRVLAIFFIYQWNQPTAQSFLDVAAGLSGCAKLIGKRGDQDVEASLYLVRAFERAGLVSRIHVPEFGTGSSLNVLAQVNVKPARFALTSRAEQLFRETISTEDLLLGNHTAAIADSAS